MDGFKRFTDIILVMGIIILLICGGIAGYLTHKSELKITSCRSTAAGTVVSIGKAIDIGKGFGFTKYTAEYTVDGQTDPTTSTGTEYSAPFTVEDGAEVRAIAYVTHGGTTISSSVSSETAVVPEGATFGKKFLVNNVAVGPTGALTDDETRFVSPKIPITGGTSYSWVYKNATFKVDYVVEYNSSNAKNEYWNIAVQGQAEGTITKTAKTGTAYVRFSGLIGSAQAGMKITSGGNTLWEYDGSTE